MKGSNIFLIIITSIITFIGLIINKLYDKYVKKNIIVQGCLYVFWTALVLRAMYWVTKPLIPHGLLHKLHLFPISIQIADVSPTAILVTFVLGIVGLCIFFKRLIEDV